MRVIPQSVRRLWDGLELRLLVLLSLTLQILLIFFAIFRKRSANKLLCILLWGSYLGADYVATLALGNLLSKETDDSNQGINGELVAFWAPFLLLHLGGPDGITSYSLEDNELWLRHLLGLVVQVSTAVLAFLLSLPSPGLWQPAIAVFISGSWKFAERTWTLRAASLDKLRESKVIDPYSNFIKEYVLQHVDEVEPKTESDLPLSDIEDPTEVTLEAYRLFTCFKGLIVDAMISAKDRKESRTFFYKCTAGKAFRVVEIELSFLYDILHTKASLVYCMSGLVTRFLTFCATLSAALLFLCIRHRSFNEADILVTYILLGGAVILETISIVMLVLSDWMIVALWRLQMRKCARFVFDVANCCFPKGKRWWSNSISQCNLIGFCVADRKETKFKRVMKLLRLKEAWDNFWHIQRRGIPDKLKELIFEKLKERANRNEGRDEDDEDDDSLLCRVGWVFPKYGPKEFEQSLKMRYEDCILVWHIATDLFFNIRKNTSETKEYREMSKLLSNYMVYLLVMQPAMMPAGVGKMRFDDTCADAKKILAREAKVPGVEKACHMLLELDARDEGESKESVLSVARDVVEQLEIYEETEKTTWEFISAVWVELMCYGAEKSTANVHAKHLTLGGELFTHVWLMMSNLFMEEQSMIRQIKRHIKGESVLPNVVRPGLIPELGLGDLIGGIE